MTALEAKLTLASYVAFGSFDTMTERQSEAVEMAAAALDKQNAKAPGVTYRDDGPWADCPGCRTQFPLAAGMKYCQFCGQRLAVDVKGAATCR